MDLPISISFQEPVRPPTTNEISLQKMKLEKQLTGTCKIILLGLITFGAMALYYWHRNSVLKAQILECETYFRHIIKLQKTKAGSGVDRLSEPCDLFTATYEYWKGFVEQNQSNLLNVSGVTEMLLRRGYQPSLTTIERQLGFTSCLSTDQFNQLRDFIVQKGFPSGMSSIENSFILAVFIQEFLKLPVGSVTSEDVQSGINYLNLLKKHRLFKS